MAIKNKPLFYVGDGTAIVDVPARDLGVTEIESLPFTAEELINSGLYSIEKPKQIAPVAQPEAQQSNNAGE